jgi:hypothetical protein
VWAHQSDPLLAITGLVGSRRCGIDQDVRVLQDLL